MPDQPAIFSISGLFKITRVWNLVIIVLTQLFAALFLLEKDWVQLSNDYEYFLLIFSTVIIAAAGYIINDYYDVKIDFINKPERVVVGKKLKRRAVMAFHQALNLLGTLGGIIISLPVFIANIFSIGLLWLYSNRLKRLPFVGNLSIALLTALSLFVVAIYFKEYPLRLILYTGFAFFFTLIREIIKDIQDLKGDEAFGCRTLPIVWGIRPTKRFIYFLMAIFTVLLFLVTNEFTEPFWRYFFIGIVIVQVILGFMIYRADTVKHFGLLSQLTKLIMLGGVLTMVIN